MDDTFYEDVQSVEKGVAYLLTKPRSEMRDKSVEAVILRWLNVAIETASKRQKKGNETYEYNLGYNFWESTFEYALKCRQGVRWSEFEDCLRQLIELNQRIPGGNLQNYFETIIKDPCPLLEASMIKAMERAIAVKLRWFANSEDFASYLVFHTKNFKIDQITETHKTIARLLFQVGGEVGRDCSYRMYLDSVLNLPETKEVVYAFLKANLDLLLQRIFGESSPEIDYHKRTLRDFDFRIRPWRRRFSSEEG